MSCGQKACAEDDEAEYQAKRREYFDGVGRDAVLHHIGLLKQKLTYFSFADVPATRGQRMHLDEIESLIRAVP